MALWWQKAELLLLRWLSLKRLSVHGRWIDIAVYMQAPGLLDLSGDDLMEDLLQVDAISHGQDWMTDL